MITACLPSREMRDEIGELPAEVRTVVWDGTGEPAEDVAATEFLVADYPSGPWSAESLARLPALKAIQLFSAGYEQWTAVVPPGVQLCNGRGVHGSATAELAVAGVLSLLRNLPYFYREQQAARWTPVHGGPDLDEKNVVVLGAGDIGRRVGAALEVFGAHASYVGRTARDGVHAVDHLPTLVPETNVLVVALPLTDDTRHLVDAGVLAALPDGAIVVNVARGPIVDTEALLSELRTGRISAFLDVTDPEPLPSDHPLWTAPNVLITPHVGGGTDGWKRRGYRLVREQLGRLVAGEPLVNVVRS